MTKEYIESLGWKDGGLFNNRRYYYLGSGIIALHLFDHSCYIAKTINNIQYDKKLDESRLSEYSDLLNALSSMYQCPEEYSFKEYLDVIQALKDF